MDINLSQFEAVIFDMDGVIVNSEPFYREVESTLFKKLGLDISEEEHNTYQGVANKRIWEIIVRKHGIKKSVDELLEMTTALEVPYFKNLPAIQAMPDVEVLIQYFQNNNLPIALATSSTPDIIEIVLKKTGLQKYFNIIVDSTMAASSKPDPDIFLLAAKMLGIQPKKCIVIEDSTNGIKAAKTAGMFCIAFAGPGSENQNQTEADFVINNFREFISCQ